MQSSNYSKSALNIYIIDFQKPGKLYNSLDTEKISPIPQQANIEDKVVCMYQAMIRVNKLACY